MHPTGFRSEPGPGSEVNPEERRNRELNREEEKSSSAIHAKNLRSMTLFDEAIRVVETEVAPESPPEKNRSNERLALRLQQLRDLTIFPSNFGRTG